jgi:hypothetical protein
MKRVLVSGFLVLGIIILAASAAMAEVKTEEKSLVKFEGMLGRMMGMFGGKSAKEGIISTVAVKGNRSMTSGDQAGQIIDLDEQKIYDLDMKKKSYETVTFDEMRRRMKEAQEKAAKAVSQETGKKPGGEKQMEIDFSLKESGQTKSINGFDCREVVMTVTAREKGKTLEEAGGMVMTSHIWMAPAIPETKEIADFMMRYYRALMGPDALAGAADQMAMALAMYPGMKDMMGKVQIESGKMDGTAILTESIMETVSNPQQAAAEERKEPESGGVASMRGIGGMLGRKLARKKEEPAAQKNRSTVFTTTHELIKVSTSVASSDLAIPSGFKEKK